MAATGRWFAFYLLDSAGPDPVTGSDDPLRGPWLLLAEGATGLRTGLRGCKMDGEALSRLSPLEYLSLSLGGQWRLAAMPDILKPQARVCDGNVDSQSQETHKRGG